MSQASAPRPPRHARRSRSTETDTHRSHPRRGLRSIALTESPFPAFAEQLRKDRAGVERQFGNLTNWGGGLTCLPAWVRTHRRVRRWVQAKLVLTRLKRSAKTTTYAA